MHERVSLLISSYEDEAWYFEYVWLVQKIFFTGVILLVLYTHRAEHCDDEKARRRFPSLTRSSCAV